MCIRDSYTRDFPYLWEGMVIPITYTADRQRAEQIMLDAVQHHTESVEALGREALEQMQRRYFVHAVTDLSPKVYYRITDNWLELSVRFITTEHGVRDVKDAISREMLAALDDAGIGIASATYEIVGFPPVQVAGEQAR